MKIFKFFIIAFIALTICSCKENYEEILVDIPEEETEVIGSTTESKIVGRWHYLSIHYDIDPKSIIKPYPSLECGDAYIEFTAYNTFHKISFDSNGKCITTEISGTYQIKNKFLILHPSHRNPVSYIIEDLTNKELFLTVGRNNVGLAKQ